VVARLIVSCEAGAYGLVVHIQYGSNVTDTTDPAATITNVKVYMDGVLLEDSGPLSHRIYVREAWSRGLPSRLHTVQLHIETWAAPQPYDLVQFAQCPPQSDTPLAQVVS
jgi:hypothetical protein